MKKTVFALLFFAILSGFPLAAKEHENILWYKNCGTWKSNASIIQSGLDSGRIAWNGKTLRFMPRGGVELKKLLRFDFTPDQGVFDLKNIYCFGFAMRVSENMRNQLFSVKFIYDEGNPAVWNLRTPAHTGWQFANAKVLPDKGPRIRPGKLKAVEFSSEVAGFQSVLDDIRFIPKGLDFQFEEAWVPPVTSGCFFPEFTLEQQMKETLNDPEFKAKMEEIEKLRKIKLKIKLSGMHKSPRDLKGNPMMERINPDGSVKGISYEDAIQAYYKNRSPNNYNEVYILMHYRFYSQLLDHWMSGRVARTKENRMKLFRGMIRVLIAETNRRCEPHRYVAASFLWPQTAVKAYGMFFDEMEAVEKGISKDPDAVLLNRLLKDVVSWCYTQPLRSTAGPVLTVDSFRHSSAWTGGNFAYRPTFKAALICRNPKMLDVIAAVAKGSLSVNSYNTMKKAC